MFSEVITQIVIPVLSTLFIALAGVLATQLKLAYQKHVNTSLKKEVAETCVKAVEQIYNSCNGEEKLDKAKENMIKLLAEKGITISNLELDMLIESVVAEFNYNFK